MLIMIALSSTLALCGQTQSLRVKEKPLGTVEASSFVRDTDIRFSASGKLVAYVVLEDWYRVPDGVAADRHSLFVNTERCATADAIEGLALAPTEEVAYCMRQGGKWHVVRGVTPGEPFERVGPPVFSGDGRSMAHAAYGAKAFVICDGIQGTPYDDVHSVTFHPSKPTVMFAAKTGERWTVIGGAEKESYERIMRGPMFSPNGRNTAFGIRTGDEFYLVVAGSRSGPFKKIIGLPVFSPDENDFTCVVSDGREESLVGKPLGSLKFKGISSPTFTPDGNAIAFIGRSGGLGAEAANEAEGKERAVVGTVCGPLFDSIRGKLVFTPSGRTVAYVGVRADQWHLVVGERLSPPYDYVSATLVLKPQQKKVEFGARRGGTLLWVEWELEID